MTKKFIAWLFLAALVLCGLSLTLTFAISKTHKVAAQAVFHSAKVQARLGRIDRVLLAGSSSIFKGPNGCMDFRYLAFGEHGIGFVNVRAEAYNSPADSTRLVEVITGLGSQFNVHCFAGS
jgi:hypothetical protein